MRIHIFFILIVGKYVIKNAKLKKSIGLKKNQIPPKPKTPLKSQKFKKPKKHNFLRIPVIFDVMFLFCPKLPF